MPRVTEIANNPITGRPAESGTVITGAAVALIIWFFKIDDPNIAAPLTIVVGAVPLSITFIVDKIVQIRQARPARSRRRRNRGHRTP